MRKTEFIVALDNALADAKKTQCGLTAMTYDDADSYFNNLVVREYRIEEDNLVVIDQFNNLVLFALPDENSECDIYDDVEHTFDWVGEDNIEHEIGFPW